MKGALGVGFPVIAAPILASFVDPQTTVVAVSVPGFFMNLFQLSGDEPLLAIIRRHARFLAVAALVTPLGALLVKRLDPGVIRLVLGLVVLGWLGFALVRVPLVLTPARERWAAPLLGALNGLIGGSTSIFFPVLAIYLIGLGLEKRRFVQAISLIFALQQLIQLGALAAIGSMTGARMLYTLAVAVPGAVGFALGQWSQRRIGHVRFMRGVRILLAITALQLVYRGLRG